MMNALIIAGATPPPTTTPTAPGQPCIFDQSNFLAFPHWYQYLTGKGVPTAPKNADGSWVPGSIVCNPQLTHLNDVWLIIAAVIEILLRVAAIVAVGMIFYAAFRFITSQGDPEEARQARGTIIDAVVGLFITVIAATVVNFIAGSIS